MEWFFFQAEDGIRDLVRSRGLGDVYKRQTKHFSQTDVHVYLGGVHNSCSKNIVIELFAHFSHCLLYTSDAADDLLCVDLGGRRIIKKNKLITITIQIY